MNAPDVRRSDGGGSDGGSDDGSSVQAVRPGVGRVDKGAALFRGGVHRTRLSDALACLASVATAARSLRLDTQMRCVILPMRYIG